MCAFFIDLAGRLGGPPDEVGRERWQVVIERAFARTKLRKRYDCTVGSVE